MNDKIIINSKDTVGVCLKSNGEIPAGHKFALRDIKAGEHVIKYGESIGKATKDIKEGEWVHTHNLKSDLGEIKTYAYDFSANVPEKSTKTFKGFKRSNRRAGVRNDIYIIPTVGCVNAVCKRLESDAQKYVTGSIDSIVSLTHQFGCSQLGIDNQNIKKLLCSIALNPNASFVLFVGLGCENNTLDGIKEYLKPFNLDYVEYFNCQDVSDEHEYGLKILKSFSDKAKNYAREEIDISELCIGLKCGGSDGYSGITANPLVGRVTDMVIGAGGSAVLTEVPEMFGAEMILMNKCKDEETFTKYVNMINDFKNYYLEQGFPVYENPSPGNKKGGITTLEEKSLGCIEKAGSTAVLDVLDYGDVVKERGLSVLNGPGNDLIASTALGASGCQMVLFTTGRGTPFSTFVPTMKISTNDYLADNKKGWIDFNAYSMDEKGLYDLVIKTANGEYKCKSEDQKEIAFYKTGVTL